MTPLGMLRERGALVLASHNAGKVAELTELLAPHGLSVTSAAALGLPVPEETERSFEGNAALKAKSAAAATGLPALADDSGLEVAALDGAPGVATADWAELADGGRDYAMAMARVRAALADKGSAEPWHARFVTILCLAVGTEPSVFFHGAVEGRLVWPARGQGGHGFDPMFVPAGHDRTFGEMSAAEKATLSHRSAAFAAFSSALTG